MLEKNDRNGSKIFLFILGVLGNLFLGGLTFYASRLTTDIANIETIARTGAANATLIAHDVEHLTKWTVEEVRELKERIKQLERK